MTNRESEVLQHEGILHTEGVWEEGDIRRLQNFRTLARIERKELMNNPLFWVSPGAEAQD